MKHLVLFYDKSKVFPQVRIFNIREDADSFINKKTNSGIDCYEYGFTSKYSKQTQIVKSDTLGVTK